MIQVLFVDDEPDVLEGLENRLRPWRKQFSMQFANSGAEALQRMQRTPVDVVVSDMRMPGMDGARLLREVRALHPETVRIILSGQADRDGVIRSLPVAHQFLSKPCDAQLLQSVIMQSCALKAQLHSEAVKTAIAGVGALPALPKLYWELSQELDQTEPSVQRAAAIIERDVAMTVRLLQVVNSAFFAQARPVCSVREAVTLLGLEPVRGLVLSSELFRSMATVAQPAGLNLERMQAHATRVALLAGTLSTDAEVRATAVTAGMLHDLGHMVLAVWMSPASLDTDRLAMEDLPSGIERERAVFGCTHAEVGAHLLALWGLPQKLVEAVAYHHHPADLPGDTLSAAGCVHVADWLAHHDGHEPTDSNHAELDLVYLKRVGRLQDLESWEARARAVGTP